MLVLEATVLVVIPSAYYHLNYNLVPKCVHFQVHSGFCSNCGVSRNYHNYVYKESQCKISGIAMF